MIFFQRWMELFKTYFSEQGFKRFIIATILIFTVVLGMLLFIEKENQGFQTWYDVVFFIFTTLTTVGYGDRVPATPLGKGIAIFLMLSIWNYHFCHRNINGINHVSNEEKGVDSFEISRPCIDMRLESQSGYHH